MAESVITDLTVKSPSRLLAEALRVKLGSSPSDLLASPPAGTLEVERSWMPVFELQDSTKTVVSLISADQAGSINTRSGSYRTTRTVTVMVSVQQLLAVDPQSNAGRDQLSKLADYSERVLRACFTKITDQNGIPFAPTDFDSTGHDQDALSEWNQFAEVHSIAFETLA